jgi:hypothetical protein
VEASWALTEATLSGRRHAAVEPTEARSTLLVLVVANGGDGGSREPAQEHRDQADGDHSSQ